MQCVPAWQRRVQRRVTALLIGSSVSLKDVPWQRRVQRCVTALLTGPSVVAGDVFDCTPRLKYDTNKFKNSA